MRAPLLARLGNRLWRRELPTWYSPAYRLPITGLEGSLGREPRRADYVVWWLLESRALSRACLRAPPRISSEELDRVHTLELIESLGRPETLARIFAADPSDVPVDALMDAGRLACGGPPVPRPALAFVIAGGDVLLGDRFGRLGLSLAGARWRDIDVATELAGVPSVWLPGGGDHPEAWGGLRRALPPDRGPAPPRRAGRDGVHGRRPRGVARAALPARAPAPPPPRLLHR